MKVQRMAMLLLLLSLVRLPAWPQDKEKGNQAASETKLQIFFSELETQWLKAIQEKDPAALNRIVSDQFQVRMPAPPGNPIPREQWLLGIFSRRLLSFQLRQVRVRELSPQIVVVSFVQTETYQQSATPQMEDHFVVDIWINSGSGDNWRCTDRYFAEVKGMPAQK
jgi:Domain of unknown function (DUF4440)